MRLDAVIGESRAKKSVKYRLGTAFSLPESDPTPPSKPRRPLNRMTVFARMHDSNVGSLTQVTIAFCPDGSGSCEPGVSPLCDNHRMTMVLAIIGAVVGLLLTAWLRRILMVDH